MADTSFNEEEWMHRFKTRLIDHFHCSQVDADAIANSTDLEDLHDSFEDDPEGAADESMSDATDDGDEPSDGEETAGHVDYD
jgi:hypothetical protein